MNAVTYLDRFLDPVANVFTPALANAIVELRADDELQADIDKLRRKAERGELTEAEQAEYAAFIDAVDVISIIQLKARRFLADQES